MKQTIKLYIAAIVAVLTVGVVAYIIIGYYTRDDGVRRITDERVEATPLVLDSIRSIGEWQLASVDVTVTVDSTRQRMLGLLKDHIVRRYHGTMSIGINMKELKENWAVYHGDTITLTLPPVCLLDSNFVNEAQTELVKCDNSSLEADSKVKAAMLATAKRKMLREGVSDEAIKTAADRARTELTLRFQQLGYKEIIIAPPQPSTGKAPPQPSPVGRGYNK